MKEASDHERRQSGSYEKKERENFIKREAERIKRLILVRERFEHVAKL